MAKRIAVIDREKFKAVETDFIISICPVNRMGEECIVKGEDGKPIIYEETCTGCGICANRCSNDAIHIINLPEDLNEEPIHKYGRNGFHLYNLPTPIFGKVVGILGRNGIGKSTALKILAKMLKPNFGNLEEESDWRNLVDHFKGTEAQTYFEKLNKDEIKISFKPQQVDLIPKTTDGKVEDILRKVDERGIFDSIVKDLDLVKVLSRDIKTLSGGELQRMAIAATVMKKANLYIFDEPTSFLDIKQRIKVSKFLRELADENTAVLVVEHDLIILDYMTDLIHIMYGKEGVYGIVSHPMTTKNGMNTYLEGFIKDSNIRFRNNKIKFEKKQLFTKKETEFLTSWKGIKKTLGTFKVEAEEGEVHRKDVIGVLGENGIGKTSFIKILANVIEQDEGEVSEKIKVSYKPQYIETDSEELVINVLQDALKSHTNDLIGPLNIEPLFEKQINQLSGGELQRVAIALCLSKEVDLYLLDEPSAYLDVEQRLLISKVIKDFMDMRGKTAIVVDHDLLFLDYLSDKILVFEGEPAIRGKAIGPFVMEEGMNMFLKDLQLTFRRDKDSYRPRANKPGSQMDEKQKRDNKLYYL
ncbi:ribosome biogenesis/translation initiation ATPase RLI [Candidatus Woesearchaeota archaeon]|nr:ribosome biogenesis/translation initiation ATPase RLI [Candidatus Woesearchaeota archaeon]